LVGKVTCVILTKVIKADHSMLITGCGVLKNKQLLYSYRILDVIHTACLHIYKIYKENHLICFNIHIFITLNLFIYGIFRLILKNLNQSHLI